jgi:hypothetical protein
MAQVCADAQNAGLSARKNTMRMQDRTWAGTLADLIRVSHALLVGRLALSGARGWQASAIACNGWAPMRRPIA